MKRTYFMAAAAGALLCSTLLGAGNTQAAVNDHAASAAANLEHAATAIMQKTSGNVLEIRVDRSQPGAAYDAVVDVNGRIQAMQMTGSSITPVAGNLPSWAAGYTPRTTREFADAKLSIGQAIDIATKDGAGVPVSAEFMHTMDGSMALYKVALADPSGREQMLIDAKSGDNIENSGVLDLKR